MIRLFMFLLISIFYLNTAVAQEKIDFMFPAPVDGKITMEMNKIIKDYNNSQNEVEVRGIFTGNNYDTSKAKAIAAVRAGQAPALAMMAIDFTNDLAIQDLILPMDELFKFDKNQLSASAFLEKNFWPALQQNAKYNGDTYAIPFHNSTPILYYNKTMFDQLGIKQPPTTWDELVVTAKKITDSKADRWGLMMPTNTGNISWMLASLIYANGGMFTNHDYPGEVYYNSPTTKGALQFMQDLVYKHQVMPAGVLDNRQINVAFFSQKLGMTILSTGYLGFMKDNAKDFEFGVAMLPAKVRQAVPVGGAILVSFKGISEAQKAAAYKFLNHLVSPEISGHWSRFSGYFSPRIQAYALPEMQEFLQKNPNFKVALDQLKYAKPIYATYETFAVRQALENELAKLITNKNAKVDAAASQAQKNAEKILAPYLNRTALQLP